MVHKWVAASSILVLATCGGAEREDGVAEGDQMFVMDTDGRNVRRVSAGGGRTTCGYFHPSGERIVYRSTHHVDEACPAPPTSPPSSIPTASGSSSSQTGTRTSRRSIHHDP